MNCNIFTDSQSFSTLRSPRMGIAERKEREKEQRRAAIVDAAESVFFTKGVEIATMDEVAEKAELSKGTLYLYFKSKTELYMAICERGLCILHENFDAISNLPLSGQEKLRRIGHAYFDFSQQHPEYFKASFHFEMHDMDIETMDSEIAQSCESQGSRLLESTVSVIEEGIRDGSIHPSQDPKELAVMLWSSMRGVIQILNMKSRGHQIAILSDLNLEDLAPHFINLILEGVRHAPAELAPKA